LKRLTRTILLITGLISIGPAVTAAPSSDTAQAKEKEAELERLRSTIQDLSNNLNSLRSQHQEQRTRLRTLNQKISRMNQVLRDTETQRGQQAAKLANLQQQRKEKQNLLSRQRQALAQQLRAAYLLGHQGSLKILLNATEPAELQRSLRYYDYLYRRRGQQIATIKDTLVNFNILEQAVLGKQRDLDTLLDRQRSEHESLEVSRRERSALLADLNRDIQDASQRLGQLKEDEQSLQDLVKRLRQALAENPAPRGPGKRFAQLKGQLRLPTKGTIAAHFGAARQVGQLKWQGIIIDAADGADVTAVAAGRVVFADWLRGFGLLLIIDHGGGYMSLYGYNQDLHKNVGESVKAGDVIATVGNSGGRKQSGLYFEIRQQGSPVDPLAWCKGK
jgi:septal ring factor EnvC (AmiA/AmiB activator)